MNKICNIINSTLYRNCLLSALLCSTALAQPTVPPLSLPEGNWLGFYQPAGGERIQSSVIVTYKVDSQAPSISVQLHLEPQESFRYSATDIQIEKNTLRFSYQRGDHVEICQLTQTVDFDLEGQCHYQTAAKEVKLSILTMQPTTDSLERRAQTENPEPNSESPTNLGLSTALNE